jgi:hypothetical protein
MNKIKLFSNLLLSIIIGRSNELPWGWIVSGRVRLKTHLVSIKLGIYSQIEDRVIQETECEKLLTNSAIQTGFKYCKQMITLRLHCLTKLPVKLTDNALEYVQY